MRVCVLPRATRSAVKCHKNALKKPIVRWACAMPVGHAIKYPHARYSYRGSGLARASYTGIHPPPTQTRSGCSCWSGCRCALVLPIGVAKPSTPGQNTILARSKSRFFPRASPHRDSSPRAPVSARAREKSPFWHAVTHAHNAFTI